MAIYADFRLYFEGNIVVQCSLQSSLPFEFGIKTDLLRFQLKHSCFAIKYTVLSILHFPGENISGKGSHRMCRHQLLRT